MEPEIRCVTCDFVAPFSSFRGTCPRCGPVLGTLDVVYPYGPGEVSFSSFGPKGAGIFRFAPLLPVAPPSGNFPLLVGDTPLYEVKEVARDLGLRRLWIKDEGRNPSASMKDRASALAVAHALATGHNVIAAASTGNAASSLALLAAAASLKAILFVPKNAPKGKLAQMLVANARVVMVDGTYDQAFDLCAKACERFSFYSRNTATNPVLAEGKKTCAFEVAEALSENIPDVVAVGVGDGCVFAALEKGFRELFDLGLIKKRPRMLGVQAEGCAPLAEAFRKGVREGLTTTHVNTYADSIAVGSPRDRVKALRAAYSSGGAIIAVPDSRIREAVRLLARKAGVFAEPAGAAGLAGVMEAIRGGLISKEEEVLVVVSGHGLKDIDGAMSAVEEGPTIIPPTEEGLEKVASILCPLTT